MGKVVIACIGSYLECVGVDLALIEAGIYGTDVVKSKVMSGKHYVKVKEGMGIICEVMFHLMFEQFMHEKSNNYKLTDELDIIKEWMAVSSSAFDDKEVTKFQSSWNQAMDHYVEIRDEFNKWISENQFNENIVY